VGQAMNDGVMMDHNSLIPPNYPLYPTGGRALMIGERSRVPLIQLPRRVPSVPGFLGDSYEQRKSLAICPRRSPWPKASVRR
jgi:hypothetical protein